jgi:hypothetical protein
MRASAAPGALPHAAGHRLRSDAANAAVQTILGSGKEGSAESEQRRQGERVAAAPLPVRGAGRGDRHGPLPRGEMVSTVWNCIKSHTWRTRRTAARSWLTTRSARSSKDEVTMFEMNKHLAQHLK